nr:MAG TPA: helix-turn-helix domain-containing protein [Caudoviricetes sp.]
MESVIVSIKPEWLEKIIRGEKTIEVRKSAPKEVPFRAYIYCTKSKEYEVTVDEVRDDGKQRHHNGKGKVVAMFVCDRVDNIEPIFSFCDCYSGYDDTSDCIHFEGYSIDNERLKKTCLTQQDLCIYGNGNRLYGWHISDLRILPRPQDLSIYSGRKKVLKGEKVEIEKPCIFGSGNRLDWKPIPLTRPPQSWQYLY